jgi:eukaryotic-like serine/threonine-protein kinase
MTIRGDKLSKPTYAILRSLKGGRTGDVYEADHKVFGRKCVQKTYSTLGMEDALAHQEPRLLHTIEHANVVEVLEAQYDPDIPDAITFVAVYYEGGSIADAFDQGYRFSIFQAIKLTTDVLAALAHVHTVPSLRVIHRDVKPGNVFLDATRATAYLGDWGSAARMEADGTVAGIEGSPLYTPPEAGPVSGRMGVEGDVYGMSMTLFELLNGPFDYAAINPAAVDKRLTKGDRALPESKFVWSPHVAPELRSIVRKGLRREPAKRHRTASELITELHSVRCIDWTHIVGVGLDGVWEGSWPPHVAASQRRRYRVVSRVLATGPCAGQRRVEAYQARSAHSSFARFGIADATVEPEDRDALSLFFSAVQQRAAHLFAAR